ncbi:MAG: electron transfer flavoprotein subunit alpha/FixB family protein [Desulfobacteraceae bacterium]|jgi:electron transfer flavoprotein alpha subunit
MKGDILVIGEHREGVLDNVTWELIGKGRSLADQWGTSLAVLVLGSELESVLGSLKSSGVDLVLQVEHHLLKAYNTELYTTAMAQVCRQYNPALVLMGYNYLGMETGPAMAVRLGGTMVSNCSELEAEGDHLVAVRPVFGGTLQVKVRLQGPVPHVISIVKGALPREVTAAGEAAVETPAVELDETRLRSRILDTLSIDTGGIDITKAKILVSAGRGIGGPDKIPLIRDLANALGGELACSRPVADMGWLPIAHQVGISASTVTPDVYIACGISGASQHVTAMRDSGRIIAINKDPNAPIFRVAHYGIVGDVLEVVPALIERARI